jgi:hypothetical protein
VFALFQAAAGVSTLMRTSMGSEKEQREADAILRILAAQRAHEDLKAKNGQASKPAAEPPVRVDGGERKEACLSFNLHQK